MQECMSERPCIPVFYLLVTKNYLGVLTYSQNLSSFVPHLEWHIKCAKDEIRYRALQKNKHSNYDSDNTQDDSGIDLQ